MIKLKPQTNHKCVNLKSYSVGFCTLWPRFPEAAALPKVHGHRGLALVKDQRDSARPLETTGTANFWVCCNQGHQFDINLTSIVNWSKDWIASEMHMKGYLDVSWNKTNIAVPWCEYCLSPFSCSSLCGFGEAYPTRLPTWHKPG